MVIIDIKYLIIWSLFKSEIVFFSQMHYQINCQNTWLKNANKPVGFIKMHATSLLKSGLSQLVICGLVKLVETTCSKPADNKSIESTCNKFVDNRVVVNKLHEG